MTGKYDKPTSFEIGDHRSGVKDFADQKVINKMKQNKLLLEKRFAKHKYPVMRGLVDALFDDAKSGCVLLGQRNVDQVNVASTLGEPMDEKDSVWVKSLYQH